MSYKAIFIMRIIQCNFSSINSKLLLFNCFKVICTVIKKNSMKITFISLLSQRELHTQSNLDQNFL